MNAVIIQAIVFPGEVCNAVTLQVYETPYALVAAYRWINPPGPRLNIKDRLPRYGDSHVKDKTAGRTSYL